MADNFDKENSIPTDTGASKLIEPHFNKDELQAKDDADNKYTIKNGAYVRISDDKMEAWIYLNPPPEGTKPYDKVDILKFLYEHNVKKGYHTSNIAAIVKKHVYGREVLVARGVLPKDGEPGFYEFMFDISRTRKPKIRDDGTVDYSAMTNLSNVNAGDVVAVYHHATLNEDGYDVLGNYMKSKPAKELVPLRGKSITNADNPDVYKALISGKIDYKQNTIDIQNTYEVRGNVDLVTGKVEFFGDIYISGNVEAGVTIRASRNVTIDGVVEAANIYAGGDVLIKRGIQGGQKGRIVSKGNVSADFIEHCQVECTGDVRANSYISAEVDAMGHVYADGKNGSIIGGRVRGLLGVTAQTLGNDSETKTTVAAGYLSEEYSTYIETHQKEGEAQALLSKTVDRITQILKVKRLNGGTVSEAEDKELMELNALKDQYFKELDEARMNKEKYSSLVSTGKGSAITCNDKIYRGVTLVVEGTSMYIPSLTSYMRYRNEGGKVTGSVIKSY